MKKFLAILSVLALSFVLVGQVEAARGRTVTKTKTVTRARGNRAVTKTRTVTRVRGHVGSAAHVQNAAFVAHSHAGFAVAHNHAFVAHGYNYHQNFAIVQPVTFALAYPQQVATLPVDIINAPATSYQAQSVTATQSCQTTAAVALPAYVAPQKVIQTQVIKTVNVPVAVGVHRAY